MNAIVKIENQTPFIEVNLNGKSQLGVNARDMHHWLESKQDFSTWIKRRIVKYKFQENIDYLLHQVVEQGITGAKYKYDLPVERYIFNECIFTLDNLFLDESHKKAKAKAEAERRKR